MLKLPRLWKAVGHAGSAQFIVQALQWGVPAVIAAIATLAALADGRPFWIVLLVCLLALTAATVLVRYAFAVWEWIRDRKESPIRVANHIAADCEPLITKDGAAIPGGYSVALKLLVFNGHDDGATLRNLEARCYSVSGEWARLPIRKTAEGTVNLRHGERAEIELGRVLFRVEDINLPAMFRGGDASQVVDPEEFRCNAIPKPGGNYAILKLGDALAPGRSHIANQIGGSAPVFVVLSSDDNISRKLRLNVAIDPSKQAETWVEFLEGAEHVR